MSKKDGGPAFPVETYGDGRGMQTGPASGWETGMSLRDYFAGQAIAAILTNKEDLRASGVATAAYQIADAMLQARAQGEG